MATAGGAAAGGAGAAAIQAVRASGVVVTLEPGEFLKVLYRIEDPVVVVATQRFIGRRKYRYLTSWKGLAFTCSSPEPLELGAVEVISAEKLWTP
jgi:hypothetical protein